MLRVMPRGPPAAQPALLPATGIALPPASAIAASAIAASAIAASAIAASASAASAAASAFASSSTAGACSECQSLRHSLTSLSSEVEHLRQALSAEQARSATLTKDNASLHAALQKNVALNLPAGQEFESARGGEGRGGSGGAAGATEAGGADGGTGGGVYSQSARGAPLSLDRYSHALPAADGTAEGTAEGTAASAAASAPPLSPAAAAAAPVNNMNAPNLPSPSTAASAAASAAFSASRQRQSPGQSPGQQQQYQSQGGQGRYSSSRRGPGRGTGTGARHCKECNSEGHDRRTCPQLGRGKAGSGRKKRGGAAGAASGAGSAAGGAADGVTGGDTTPGGNKAASKK